MNQATKNTFLLIIFWLISNNLLAQKTNIETKDFYVNNANLIDSLIFVKKINDKTILLSFGADAVAAIKTQKGIVVIDAGISTVLTSKYRKKIEESFQSKRFAYVINTHGHPDHYGGNSVFSEAKIIGQENGLKEISAQLVNPKKKQRLLKIVEQYDLKLNECVRNTKEWYDAYTQKTRYYYALNDAKLKISIKGPEITFSNSYKIEMGDVSIEMIYFGKCHSESDILIYVPELNMLFTGDLMSKYGRPSINDSLMQDKVKWKRAIAWIKNRISNIEIIINGHGELLGKKDLKYFNNYMFEKSSE